MEAKLLLMVPFTYSVFACKSHQYCLSQTLLILARAILLYKMHLWDMGCICHRHLIYVLLRECTPVKMYLLIIWLCQWHIAMELHWVFISLIWMHVQFVTKVVWDWMISYQIWAVLLMIKSIFIKCIANALPNTVKFRIKRIVHSLIADLIFLFQFPVSIFGSPWGPCLWNIETTKIHLKKLPNDKT